jgi:hypothetical protein
LQGLNAALFYENPDVRSYVSLVPTSAITGEGIGNLLALIVDSCQNMLAKRLMYSEELQVLAGEYLYIKKTKFLDQLHRCLHLINKFPHLAWNAEASEVAKTVTSGIYHIRCENVDWIPLSQNRVQ